jgi:hypothetical protein
MACHKFHQEYPAHQHVTGSLQIWLPQTKPADRGVDGRDLSPF